LFSDHNVSRLSSTLRYLKDYFTKKDISSFSIPLLSNPIVDTREDYKAILVYYKNSSINNKIDTFIDLFL
jgi:hypothetical protein